LRTARPDGAAKEFIQSHTAASRCAVEFLSAALLVLNRHRKERAQRAGAEVPLILTIERKLIPPDITVLEMTGRIIMGNNSRDVELKLTEILQDNAKKIIFDITGISIVDSTGIGILVLCQGKIVKEGGTLHVAGATDFVKDVFRMTSVDKLIHLYPTVAEAVAGFEEH
jgi:anti-anti-sigma factor